MSIKGDETQMITDECRRDSNEKVDRAKRYMQIKEVLKGHELTAKEVAVELFNKNYIPSTERNYSAPRLTELEKRYRVVMVVGRKKCSYTGKQVAVYKLIDDDHLWEQLKIDLRKG